MTWDVRIAGLEVEMCVICYKYEGKDRNGHGVMCDHCWSRYAYEGNLCQHCGEEQP